MEVPFSMNFDIHTEHLSDLLTSCSWDGGIGQKMLFTPKRYYVFDDDHRLIDGGVVKYNETLEKIFIFNEDLKGEVFIRSEEENLRLEGSAYSKRAGLIHIDTRLHPYHQTLNAPLSRVADVEKYLTKTDVFNILMGDSEIDAIYLRNFNTYMHRFSALESQQVYIKLAQDYFRTVRRNVLESICFYFSAYALHKKLYEEMFMFVIALQSAFHRNEIPQEHLDLFVDSVKERLLDAHAWRSPAISTNLINETLFFFKLDSPNLPTPQTCVNKLYAADTKTQREHAFYLALMAEKAKAVEEEIFRRVLIFHEIDFYFFMQAFNMGELLQVEQEESTYDKPTFHALLEALGNTQSSAKEVHMFFVFLLFHPDEHVKSLASRGLLKCKAHMAPTLQGFHPNQYRLRDQIRRMLSI